MNEDHSNESHADNWVRNAIATLAETRIEIRQIAEGTWEKFNGMPYPGPGYLLTMLAQERRLLADLATYKVTP